MIRVTSENSFRNYCIKWLGKFDLFMDTPFVDTPFGSARQYSLKRLSVLTTSRSVTLNDANRNSLCSGHPSPENTGKSPNTKNFSGGGGGVLRGHKILLPKFYLLLIHAPEALALVGVDGPLLRQVLEGTCLHERPPVTTEKQPKKKRFVGDSPRMAPS